MKTWTYGAEHELADWPMGRLLPPGYKRDVRDITIVNSNGIANDPMGRDWRHGGEINTPPTDTLDGQVACLEELVDRYPEAKVNYRSNLHLHIRVPGLKDDLKALKRVQWHIHTWMPHLLPIVEPELSVRPQIEVGETLDDHVGHLRRWKRRRVSHWTLLTAERLQRQMEADTAERFFEAEVPRSKAGQVMWHAQPRLCVNLRQLRETDTVEFRHFPGTLNPADLAYALRWCVDYLSRALQNEHCGPMIDVYRGTFRPFPRYSHWHEVRYRATVHDGSVKREQIQENIRRILDGTFTGE